MQAIRKINPNARLVQTDDLGKIHSTPLLQNQADFENDRRWLSYDLLCGKVNRSHPLWQYLLNAAIRVEELDFFIDNRCEPDVIGINHYLTSERYLDDDINSYPAHTHGGNGHFTYADVEAVRVGTICPDGPYKLLKEAWERYGFPMAVTELHLFYTREEQMRWVHHIWLAANQLKEEGVQILAITPWALLGSFGWNRLLTQAKGDYEPGIFDLGNNYPRPTMLAQMVHNYSTKKEFHHPVLDNKGWWQRSCRVIYGNECFYSGNNVVPNTRPVLVIGKTSSLGKAFEQACNLRGIACYISSQHELNITDVASIEQAILTINPWAIINISGFMRVEEA